MSYSLSCYSPTPMMSKWQSFNWHSQEFNNHTFHKYHKYAQRLQQCSNRNAGCLKYLQHIWSFFAWLSVKYLHFGNKIEDAKMQAQRGTPLRWCRVRTVSRAVLVVSRAVYTISRANTSDCNETTSAPMLHTIAGYQNTTAPRLFPSVVRLEFIIGFKLK